MSDTILNEVAGWIALACLVPALYATFRYALGAAWHTSWLGRVIFAQWVSIDAVFLVVLSRRFFGEYQGYGLVALVVYSALLVALTAKAAVIDVEIRGPEFRTRVQARQRRLWRKIFGRKRSNGLTE